jgi:hypothetical protein
LSLIESLPLILSDPITVNADLVILVSETTDAEEFTEDHQESAASED